MATNEDSAGIPSLREVAARVFAATFCTILLVAAFSNLTALETVGIIRVEETSADIARPIFVLIGNLIHAGFIAAFNTILVCVGFAGWRRSLSKARN